MDYLILDSETWDVQIWIILIQIQFFEQLRPRRFWLGKSVFFNPLSHTWRTTFLKHNVTEIRLLVT